MTDPDAHFGERASEVTSTEKSPAHLFGRGFFWKRERSL